MAANAPVIWTPSATVRPWDRLELVKSPYSGAGAKQYVRWIFGSTWDSLWREPDGRWITDDTIIVWPELIGCVPGDVISVTAKVRNTLYEESAASAAVTITIDAAKITATRWLRGLG